MRRKEKKFLFLGEKMFIFSRTYKQRKHWSVGLGLICSFVLPLLMFVGPKVSIDSKGLIRGVWS